MTDAYVELHCHSHYSLLDAPSSPESLLARAASLGMSTLALTDHNGLYGAVEFWHAARKRGIHPIIGAELTLAHGTHLTLLAENQQGYANLSRLISIGQLAGNKGSPLLMIEDVARHAGGLLCLTGCSQGAVAAALLVEDEKRAVRAAGRLADLFGRGRVWIELQRHWMADDARLNAGMVEVARATGLPLVATNDVHYAVAEDYILRDILLATQDLCTLAELAGRPGTHNSDEFCLRSAAEMGRLFAELPEAVASTQAIAERCQVSLEFSGRRTPAFPRQAPDFPAGIPRDESAFSYLYGLCHQGLRDRYRPVTSQALRQLAHELVVIEAVGLADYFLIVWDIVRHAREQGIRCQGRGSAANSMVAYVLGITPVDPLRHNLLFERFLSDRTDTMPDIDIDFAADRRDEVIKYVYELYGTDHAAMVCNVVTYQWRLAVRDVARALGFTPKDVDRVSEALHERADVPLYDTSVALAPAQARRGALTHDDTKWHASLPDKWKRPSTTPLPAGSGSAQDASRHLASETRRHPERNTFPQEGVESKDASRHQLDEHAVALVANLAARLIDTPRHLSVHSGGILITAQPLVEVVPLERATKESIVVTQWNKDSVEDAGLIKIDLLCLRTLDLVSEAEKLITAHAGGQKPPLDSLTLDDPAVYRSLSEGDTIGAFQVESRAQAQMLPRLRPQRFEDIVIQVAIIRPGPIQGGMIHPYLRRRRGEERPTYLHPKLKPILSETLGVILFQEQVIRVAMALAGFTPGEADLLRRAMSRSRSARAMAELRERFVAGAEANNVERSVAEEAFRQLQGFATYGFCKSHAAAFALVAYQTLWLKIYYPAEFYCALLNHQPMGFYSPEVVVGDAERHGVRVLRPDVNASKDECTSPSLPLLPLVATSPVATGEGDKGGEVRLGLRYLHGLGEAGSERLLAARGDEPFVDLVNFCRRTRLPRNLIADLVRAGALDSLSPDRRGLLWTLGGLQYEEEALVEASDEVVELPELEEREALTWDYELLGLSPGDHPMRMLREKLKAKGVLSAADLAKQPAGRTVTIAGLVVVRQAPPTAKGHLFITLEDETGLANLIIRPDLYERRRSLLHSATFLMAKGVMQRDGVSTSVLVRNVLSTE